MTVTQAVGEELRRLRIDRKLSTYAVAESIGKNQGNYSRIETGHTRLKYRTLVLICRVLKTDPEELLINVRNSIKVKKADTVNVEVDSLIIGMAQVCIDCAHVKPGQKCPSCKKIKKGK